ncbi:N-acetyltransferase [Pseudomonas massiliensis]|uniref:N-acetyltransferase n=1 Tax=Pseudomonas massiliensis TaxID=522492 RepID=UPI001E4375FA|nr:N-acetyltransferase [Pseudomonas massiliensis]
MAFKTAHGIILSDLALKQMAIDVSRIRFTPIDHHALEASYLWPQGLACFPWEDIHRWKEKDPRGIDVALWFASELCGLCYATPRRSKLCIKIILLEGNPMPRHSLKGLVAPLILTVIRAYAITLGCTCIEIEKPAEGAVAWYKKLGFYYNGENRLVIPILR